MGVYSGYTLNESGSVQPKIYGGHIMDTVIEAVTNDRNMFDAVISLDFIEAYNEDAPLAIEDKSAASEESKTVAKKSIVKKIKELFAKIIAKIKEFVSTFAAKVSNLIHDDDKLYRKYSEAFEKNVGSAKLEKFSELKTGGLEEVKKQIASTHYLKYREMARLIDAASDTEAVNKAVEAFKSDKKDKKLDLDTDTIKKAFIGDEKENSVLDSETAKAVKEIMYRNGGKKLIEDIKKFGDSEVSLLKSAEKELKLDKAAAKDIDGEGKDISLSKINAKYNIANKLCQSVSKDVNASCNIVAKYIAAGRKLFISVARKAAATGESAVMEFVLGEASDMYVEKALLG